MKDIFVRYGASLPLSISIDDVTATSATIVIGKEGYNAPVFTKTASFVEGVADLTLDPAETEIPLGEYNYQVNVAYTGGTLDKFPSPETCEDGLPKFVVLEALDVIEVS